MVRKIFFGTNDAATPPPDLLNEELPASERGSLPPEGARSERAGPKKLEGSTGKMRILFSLLLLFTIACKHKTQDAPVEEKGTPVRVTTVNKKFLNDTLSLYGTLSFVKKTPLLSPIAGFIQSVTTNPGDIPEVGKILFTLKTKEAAAYPDFVADTLFKNMVITVKANHQFRVDSVLKEAGDFV